ncbi:MAG: type 1 glutamine amidotransferase [Pseudomonadota bacterium]
MRVMVVEGNTPELVAATRDAGAPMAPAEAYAAALRRHAPVVGTAFEIVIARPFFPEPLPALDGVAGAALTGSGVAFSADAAEAARHRAFVERLFAAGIPVLGSCWGLQVATVILGGAVGASPAGIEVPVANALTLTAAGRLHPLHAGRPAVFDAPCIHRDIVTRRPSGAVVTASNAHCTVQAMVYELDGVRLWGVQYHPEHAVSDMLRYLTNAGSAALTRGAATLGGAYPVRLLAEVEAVEADPQGRAAEARRLGLDPCLLDPMQRGVELASWLESLGDPAVERCPALSPSVCVGVCVGLGDVPPDAAGLGAGQAMG